MFRHYYRHPRFRGHASSSPSYTSVQVASLYSFPAKTTGKGVVLAFVSLGGALLQSDVDQFCKLVGITSVKVQQHVLPGADTTSDPQGADVENALDAQNLIGGAPGATIHMVSAPNTEQGFADAITYATDTLGCDAGSISWGAPEDQWTKAGTDAMNAAFVHAKSKGVNWFVASGDNGSTDGERGNHVDFPASSPYVVGCGGTTIVSTTPLQEKVWNDGSQGGATGGGVSTSFAIPSFQSTAGVPGGKHRGVPDIALNADPETGYVIVSHGQQMVIGGTSGAAPMACACAARIQEGLGKRLGDWNALFYPLSGTVTHDITVGNNGTYVANAGKWDACTGIGTPNGQKMLSSQQAAPPAPTPVPVPVPTPTPTPAPTPVPTGTDYTIVVKGAQSVTVNGKAV